MMYIFDVSCIYSSFTQHVICPTFCILPFWSDIISQHILSVSVPGHSRTIYLFSIVWVAAILKKKQKQKYSEICLKRPFKGDDKVFFHKDGLFMNVQITSNALQCLKKSLNFRVMKLSGMIFCTCNLKLSNQNKVFIWYSVPCSDFLCYFFLVQIQTHNQKFYDCKVRYFFCSIHDTRCMTVKPGTSSAQYMTLDVWL
jgi:hypothetical protein